MRTGVLLCGLALVLSACARSPRHLLPSSAAAPHSAQDAAPARPAQDSSVLARSLCCPAPTEQARDLDCYCLRRARRTSNWITVGVCSAMLLYGVAFWDYGSNSWKTKDDGWFGPETPEGGADKTGHATAAHIATAVFSAVNRRIGIPRREAALRGAFTTWLYLALVEIGDGFSEEHSWTYGDMVANTAGCVFGYFHETSPRFNRLLDLRWEYFPTSNLFDGTASEPSVDYDGSGYFLALNVGALAHPRRRSWLDVVDLQVGYQARNFQDMNGERERTAFLGVGVNFANLLRRLGVRGLVPTIFEYYQPPYTSLRVGLDL